MKRTLISFGAGILFALAVIVAVLSPSVRQLAPREDDYVAGERLQAYGFSGNSEGGGGIADMKREALPSAPPSAAAAPQPALRASKNASKKMAMEAAPEAEEMADEPIGASGHAAAGDAETEAVTRSWFPETFLFEPLVLTDASGEASVPVKIPDRLTGWRVLALAHARTGEQAGTVATFQGTLPVYVEPVLPGFLIAGDEIRLPVQLVNTTDRAISGPLTLEADGLRWVENPSGQVTVDAGGTLLRYAVVQADTSGTAIFRARFGKADSLVKELPVLPAGRLMQSAVGGTLAAPRKVTLTPAAGSLPGSARVRLTVYPGALAVLRNELNAAISRPSAADDAYALLLAGRGEKLLENLGEKADRESLRRATIVLQQRALRHARAPDGPTAALFAEAALAHPENPLLARLGERLSETTAKSQRPDGTFEGGNGWTLQRLLVATADAMRAVSAAAGSESGKKRATAATVRASGAFERYVAQVNDGYTAAAILASGVASGSVAERLREKVRSSIVVNPDGSRHLPVETGVVRADGVPPSSVEATATAILALKGDAAAPRADLGAFLLGSYSPHFGFGDGRANLVALRAILEVFSERLPSQVQVVLERDGKVVTEGTLSPDKSRDVLTLEAGVPNLLGSGSWTVRAQPEVPGLGFRLELASYVPWKPEPSNGLELSVAHPTTFKVGAPAELSLSAVGPVGTSWSLRAALPAGVQVDRASLDAQQSQGVFTSYELEDGAVTLTIPPRHPSNPGSFSTTLRVFPTLAGKLNAGASMLSVEGRPDWIALSPTPRWTVQ